MDSLFEKFCQYLNTATTEEKQKSWEKTAPYSNLGPTVEEYESVIDYYKAFILDNTESQINFIQKNIGQNFNSDLFYIQ